MEVVCTDADGRRRVGNGFAYKCKSHAGGFKQLFRRDRCESQFSTDGATESVTAEGDCTCWIARFGNGPLARESGTETAEGANAAWVLAPSASRLGDTGGAQISAPEAGGG